MKQQTVGSLIDALSKFPRELEIMVATDDEGNDYRHLYDSPTFGYESEYGDVSFTYEEYVEDGDGEGSWVEYDVDISTANVVVL